MIRIRTDENIIGEFSFIVKKKEEFIKELSLFGYGGSGIGSARIADCITEAEANTLLDLIELHINSKESRTVFNIPETLERIRENNSIHDPLEMATQSTEEIMRVSQPVKSVKVIPDYDGGVNV